MGLVAPGDWIDFFRYVGETYKGIIVPENDDRNLGAMLGEKMMVAKDRFDVHFKRDYQPPEVADWMDSEKVLPGPESRTSFAQTQDRGGFWAVLCPDRLYSHRNAAASSPSPVLNRPRCTSLHPWIAG
jgi:hypothetical protein